MSDHSEDRSPAQAATGISDGSIEFVAQAIFKQMPVVVIEADSSYGALPVRFECAQALCAYISAKRLSGHGSAHIAIHYPDMGGELQVLRVSLDPGKCHGHTFRYAARGWGLLYAYFELQPGKLGSFISANSEKRANAWRSGSPELAPPSAWNWPAVGRHLRRLQRVLKNSG